LWACSFEGVALPEMMCGVNPLLPPDAIPLLEDLLEGFRIVAFGMVNL
jgi:hypothetical protein